MYLSFYNKVKKGNARALRLLQDMELPWAWFVSYQITEDVCSAAELLRCAWKNTLIRLVRSERCPNESFRVHLAREIYRLLGEPLPVDDMFSSLDPPWLDDRFDFFIENLRGLEPKDRAIYLLNRFGGLDSREITELMQISLQDANEYLYSLDKKVRPKNSGMAVSDLLYLSNEFSYVNRHLFEGIVLEQIFLDTLSRDYQFVYDTTHKYTAATARREHKSMAQKNKKGQQRSGGSSSAPSQKQQIAKASRRASAKKKKTIFISSVIAVLVIAIIVTVIVTVNRNNQPELTRITTYNIDEVTYGSVSTTISGSSYLTPITKETLTVADCFVEDTEDSTEGDAVTQADDTLPGTDMLPSGSPVISGSVSDIQVKVGDAMTAGDTVATITLEDGTTATLAAPYDCVLLEFYLHDADSVTTTSSVAMFMGTDGYTMSISVDETNISTIEIGQEVDISIDAVSGDYTGSVTDISYNGSTSGSVTAYQIKVTFDYVEGTYPGMSVSADIVIEDSGDGLLVPVDAVYTSGDTKYVYLAPDDSVLGDEYEEEDMDVSKLTKITVETGMSDGTFIVIKSDDLKEGDLIVITKITSTLTGSDSEGSSGSMGGFGGGGMGGGGMGGFGGGGMPDFSGGMPDFSGGFPGFN